MEKLSLPILVNGYLTDAKGAFVKGSLKPTANVELLVIADNKPTLLVTNECGGLFSINKALELQAGHQKPAKKSLSFTILPPNLVASTFLADSEKWQPQLLDEVNKIASKPTIGLPIQCKTEDFDAESIKEYANFFKPNKQFSAFITPRLQSALFVIDDSILELGALTVLRSGRTEFKFESLKNSSAPGSTKLFYAHSESGTMPKGNYILTELFLKSTVAGKSNNFVSKKFPLSFDLQFPISTYYADLDIQYVTANSLEESIASTFPENFGDLLAVARTSINSEPEGDIPPQIAGLETWIQRQKAFHSAQKSVISGYNQFFEWGEKAVKIDNMANKHGTGRTIKKLTREYRKHPFATVGKAIQEISGLLGKNTTDKKEIYAHISSTIGTCFNAAETVEKWGDLVLKMQARAKYGSLVQKVVSQMDAPLLTRFYVKCKAQDWLLSELQSGLKKGFTGEKKELLYLLNKDKLKESQIRFLKNKAFHKDTSKFEKMIGKGGNSALKVFSALNTAVTIYQVYSAWNEVSEGATSWEAAEKIFGSSMDNYKKKFGLASCEMAIRQVETLRKKADKEKLDLNEKEKELYDKAATAVLGTLAFVPVVGEAAALILFAKEAAELGKNAMDELCYWADLALFNSAINGWKKSETRCMRMGDEHRIQVTAILKARKDGLPDTHPLIQYRVRVILLIGLARLLERLPKHHGNQLPFADKIKQYNIDEYLQLFFFGAKNAVIPLDLYQPVDYYWHIYRGSPKSGILAWDSPWPEFKNTSMLPSIKVAYRDLFPIHFRNSQDTVKLAEVFSLNHGGLTKVAKFDCKVMIRDSQDKLTFAGNDKIAISPYSPIEIVIDASCTESNLTGLGVSVQLIRKRFLVDIPGPIYKGFLEPYQSDDKQEKSNYRCLIKPYYHFGAKAFFGIKPFGHIAMARHSLFQVEFRVEIGDKIQSAKTHADGKSILDVHMNLSRDLDMIINDTFLANKTQNATYHPLFMPPMLPKLLGVCIQKNGSWHSFQSQRGAGGFGAPSVSLSKNQFDFSWDKPFEIVFIFSAGMTTKWWVDQDPIKFPANLQCKELTGFDTVGPEYAVEVISLHTNKKYYRGPVPRHEIETGLVNSKVFNSFSIASGPDFNETDSGYLFAVRATFSYSVEQKGNDELQKFDAFKPFGNSQIMDISGDSYNFDFSIHAPSPIGMNLNGILQLELPGIPQQIPLNFGHLHKEKFVTSGMCQKSLKVEKTLFE